MPRSYWMLVLAPENFQVTRELGFTVQGFSSGQKRKVQRMEVGDRLLFYLTRVQRFATTATITSTFFEEHTRVWKSHSAEEEYPYRVHIEPAVVLAEEQFLDSRQIAPSLEYVKKWTPEWWALAFQGELHIIPRKDFSLLEEEMRRLTTARPAAQRASAHRAPFARSTPPPGLSGDRIPAEGTANEGQAVPPSLTLPLDGERESLPPLMGEG